MSLEKNENTKIVFQKLTKERHVKVKLCRIVYLRKQHFHCINFITLVGRPRLNRTIEIPTGELKPEKPKPTQALLKQSNELVKMSTQNVVPPSEVPLANEVVALTPTTTAIATSTTSTENVPVSNLIEPLMSKPPEVTTKEDEKNIAPQTTVAPIISLPSPIIPSSTVLQSSNQFVQIKPPTTGRMQSPNFKNFFIRKGIEKQQPIQCLTPSIIPTSPTQSSISPININKISTPISASKKIIIKSQQILVPASNIKQATNLETTSSTNTNLSTPISVMSATDSIANRTADLSGILDLPILFADSEENIIDQSPTQIFNTSNASNLQIVSSNPNTSSISNNILITTADGKLPNRPVVISTAKITKSSPYNTPTTTLTTTSSNKFDKVIFINRNQIKPQIVTTQAMTSTSVVKTIPTLKLIPTSGATSTPLTLQNNVTKFAAGTKIDLSTLKLVKNVPTSTGFVRKPLIINKSAVIGTQPTKNAIIIKSPTGIANVQPHPAIKASVMNRNITVRKIMNVVPAGAKLTTPASITRLPNPTPANVTSPKATRKTKNSN